MTLPALAVGAHAAWAASAAPGQAVGWPEVRLLDGKTWGPAQAAGRIAVVVFWSTTCPFCRRHNQHLEKLYRIADPQHLAVLGVARESDAVQVQRHAHQQGYSFPITLDHAAMAAALSPRRLIPLTVTVDRQGRLLQVIPGEMTEEDVMGLLKLVPQAGRT